MLVQPAHVRGVRREARGPIGDGRERVNVDERGDEGRTAFGHDADQLVGQPGAVLDAVDPGVEQVGQGLLGEGVDRDPCACDVRPLDRRPQRIRRPQRRQVADLPIDPVADELDPAIASLGLDLGGRGQLVRLDLEPDSGQVAPGTGEMPAGTDDARQVGSPVDPARVDR